MLSSSPALRNSLVAVLVATSVASLSSVACVCGNARPPSKKIGSLVAARTETALDGSSTVFPAAGKVTVVDFWATWCKPCHMLMPELESLWKAHEAEGLVVLGVETGGNARVASEQVRKLGVTYGTVLDSSGRIQRDYGVDTLPHTVVIDRQGRIRAEVVGMSSSGVREIRSTVEAALRER